MNLFWLFGKSSVLYFPGCTAYFKFKEGFKMYKEIFSKLGIGFGVLDEQICCGLEALEAGYENEARKLARKNFKVFKEQRFDSIITSSPECYKMFLQNYHEILPDWNIEVRNIWEMILEKLKWKSRLIKYKAMEVVGFHDNCYLGRYCKVYNEPRKILEAIGYKIKEMDNFKENSFCCGSCGGLGRTNPELANKIARERILQAKRIGIKKIIVVGFDNYNLLKKNTGDSGVEVLELSDVLGLALGIKEIEKKSDEIIEGEGNILEKGEDILERGEDVFEGKEDIFDEDSDEKKILKEAKANMRLQEELKEEDVYDKFEEDDF